MITKDDIRKLARTNVDLNMCVYQADMGIVSWEDAMMLAAHHLATQNNELTDMIIDIKKHSGPAPILLCKNCPNINITDIKDKL